MCGRMWWHMLRRWRRWPWRLRCLGRLRRRNRYLSIGRLTHLDRPVSFDRPAGLGRHFLAAPHSRPAKAIADGDGFLGCALLGVALLPALVLDRLVDQPSRPICLLVGLTVVMAGRVAVAKRGQLVLELLKLQLQLSQRLGDLLVHVL